MELKKKENQKDIILSSIEELAEPLKLLLEKLKNKNYDVIIADDTSARLPAIVLKKVLEKVNHQKIKLYFIHPPFLDKFQTNEKFQSEINKKLKDKKVMFFTESVFSGQTLIKLIKFFKNYKNISLDYAVLFYSRQNFKNEQDLKDYLQKMTGVKNINLLAITPTDKSKPKIAEETNKPLIGLIGDFESEEVKKIYHLNPKNLKIYLEFFQQSTDFEKLTKIDPTLIHKIIKGKLDQADFQKIISFVRQQINILVSDLIQSLNSTR